MLFSTTIATLGLLASGVFANPLAQRSSNNLEESSDGKPGATDLILPPSAKDVSGTYQGETSIGKSSRRRDFNPLDPRSSSSTEYLIVCSKEYCKGECWKYPLNIEPWKCYGTHTYESVYAYHEDKKGLGYGLFAADDCDGLLIPRVDTCYTLRGFKGNSVFRN